jgi:hypothetical protein
MIRKYVTAISIAVLTGMPLCASVTVPQDLRNPFEVPDPAGFKIQKQAASAKADASAAGREAAFEKVRKQLLDLPIKGIVSNMRNSASGEVTVLLGEYTVRPGYDFPAVDFGVKGLIKVISVTTSEIKVNVSIDLEAKTITIPLDR